MENKRLTVSFFLDTRRVLKSGKYPLYLRMVHDRKKAELRLDDNLKLEDWSIIKQEPKNPRLKEYISYLTNKLINIKRELEIRNLPISSQIIKDAFRSGAKVDNKTLLIAFVKNYISKIQLLQKDYTPGTVQHYKTTLKHLVNFLKWKNNEDLRLEEFVFELVSEFDFYMKTQIRSVYGKPLSRNTANKYHKKLRQMLTKAVKTGYLSTNPYDDFVIRNKKVQRVYLTEEELHRVEHLDLSGFPWMDKARDIFLFSAYTGLRYGDAAALSNENIVLGMDGKYGIELYQEKTTEVLSVPLTDKAFAIYKKYAKHRRITKMVLPSMANQRINTYLKTIQELSGINKQLTHHVARHTFATLALKNGVPLEVVSKMLGHTSLKSTLIYAQITRDQLLRSTRMLNMKVFV